jgi:hypothetical protein
MELDGLTGTDLTQRWKKKQKRKLKLKSSPPNGSPPSDGAASCNALDAGHQLCSKLGRCNTGGRGVLWNEVARRDLCVPSTALFHAFVASLIARYNLPQRVQMHRASVTAVEAVALTASASASASGAAAGSEQCAAREFRVRCSDGKVFRAKTVVSAVGVWRFVCCSLPPLLPPTV